MMIEIVADSAFASLVLVHLSSRRHVVRYFAVLILFGAFLATGAVVAISFTQAPAQASCSDC